jgi:cystathionine gamma-synthase
MAAITSLLESLPNRARILIPDDCYTGLRILAKEFLPERGIVATMVDMADHDAVRTACNTGIALIWAETPSNPRLKICDLAALAEIAHDADAALVCDNTFATPVLQRPLALGADVVMHSTTKYFGGHSDVLGGALIARETDDFFQRVREVQSVGGAVPAPFDCWLVHRGMQTLPWRMRAHCENARQVAEFLESHPRVARVHYPGLTSHPQYTLATRQMNSFGGMLSFERKGDRASAMALPNRMKIFTRATSLGGVESLIEHRQSIEGPESLTPDTLLRLSIGLEHPADLIADLDQALAV